MKNRGLGWLFFDLMAAARDLYRLQRGANMLSTEALTGIVGKPVNGSKTIKPG